MKLLAGLVLAVTVISANALAEISGNWTGAINYTTSNGDSGAGDLALSIDRTETNISFSEAQGWTFLNGMECEIKGSDVVLGGRVIGHIEGDTLIMLLIDDVDQVEDQVTISLNNDGTLSYADHFKTYGGNYSEDYTATLSASRK